MPNWTDTATLLAWEGEAPKGNGEAAGDGEKTQDDPPSFLPLMLLMGVFFYFIVLRPGMKDRKKHERMMNDLKQNDRVVTVGGIIGTVAHVSNDGKEVTLKVDDKTRIKFMKSHVSTIVTDDNAADRKSTDNKADTKD